MLRSIDQAPSMCARTTSLHHAWNSGDRYLAYVMAPANEPTCRHRHGRIVPARQAHYIIPYCPRFILHTRLWPAVATIHWCAFSPPRPPRARYP